MKRPSASGPLTCSLSKCAWQVAVSTEKHAYTGKCCVCVCVFPVNCSCLAGDWAPDQFQVLQTYWSDPILFTSNPMGWGKEARSLNGKDLAKGKRGTQNIFDKGPWLEQRKSFDPARSHLSSRWCLSSLFRISVPTRFLWNGGTPCA